MESVREILRKIRRLEIKTRGIVDAAFAGQYRSVFKGRGMNFEEVREYQPGDEVRTIDWNVTARYDEPYVKKFTEERELSVMLVVDVSASGNFGSVHLSKRELAAEKDKSGGHLERALQLLAEYVERYSRDAAVPEVLLRQGYLLRRLDLREEAIEKFYLVLRSVPRIEGRNLAYSRRLVLMAQSAIADTCAEMGRHAEAAELYGRMLQTKSEELEVETVRIKRLRSLKESATDGVLEMQALAFLEEFPDSDYIPEARYFLAHALKQQKKRDAALEQFQLLLEAVDLAPPERLARWLPWKLRVGNELANQFYLEGDYPSSLALYRALARSNADLQAQQAFQYQVGLCEERLGQTTEAIKTYQSIVEAPMPSATNTNGVPVQILRNMAALRISVLKTASQTSNRGGTPPTQP